MKAVILLLAAAVLMLMSPAIVDSVTDFRTDEYEAQYVAVTGAAETTTNVVLTEDLFNNSTYNAVVTSNTTGDAPIPTAYVSATNTLTVGGLIAETSNLLTVTYKYNGLSEYTGAGTGAAALPLFLILGIIGLIAGAVYTSMRGGE